MTNGLFGSWEREESRGDESSEEESREMIILHIVWMFLKLVRGTPFPLVCMF